MRWLETQGYVLCFNLAWLRVNHGRPWGWLENIWAGIWYHYYCPYPTDDNWRASHCAAAGHCGCSNLDRYGTPKQIEAVRNWRPLTDNPPVDPSTSPE